MTRKGVCFLLLTFIEALSTSAPRHAQAAYYGNYYSPYSPWQRSNGPIVSLELDENKSRNLELRIAARENRFTDIGHILSEGANINGKSEEGETALMYAARACALESTRALLKFHAKVNLQDLHGRTALMYAVMESCLPVTSLLLKAPHISLDIIDDMHLSVLEYAKQGASLEIDGPPVDILVRVESALKRQIRSRSLHAQRPH